SMPTVPGAGYQGKHAGQVRFYAGEIVITDDEYADGGGTQRFDAAGTLLSQEDVGEDLTDTTLLRRRVEGVSLELGASLSSRDRPLPLDGGHREQELCLSSDAVEDGERASSGYIACQEPLDELQPLRVGGLRGCGRVPSTLTGFVPVQTHE